MKQTIHTIIAQFAEDCTSNWLMSIGALGKFIRESFQQFVRSIAL